MSSGGVWCLALAFAIGCAPALGDGEDATAGGTGAASEGESEDPPIAECDGALPSPVLDATFEENGEIDSTHVIEHVVADAQFVYFSDGVGLHRIPRCGGEPELLVPDARPFNDGLVLAGDRLLWTTNTDVAWSVMSASTETGESEELTAFEGYTHQIRTDGRHVVWNGSVSGFPDEARLYAMTVDGGGFNALAAHRYGWSFDVDDGVVFAAGYHPDVDPEVGERLLWSLEIEGDEAVIIADGFGDEYPTGVVVAPDHVFYLRAWSSEHVAVERVARVGGIREEIDLADAPIPDHLVYADELLYGVELTGVVWELVDGGPPRVLGTSASQLYPGHVYADAGGVFMAESEGECLATDWSDGKVPVEICVRHRTDTRLWSLGR